MILQKTDYYVPHFEIFINGIPLQLDGFKSVMSITINEKVDRADTFTIEVDNHDFTWSESMPLMFCEGNVIMIVFGYHNGKTSSFLGEIADVDYSFPASGAATITVTGFDLSQRMMRGKYTKTYKMMSDCDIAALIALKHQLIPMVDVGVAPSEEIFQNDLSDYAFLKKRAVDLGFEFRVLRDEITGMSILYFKKPLDFQPPELFLIWRESLISFNVDINITQQVMMVEARGLSDNKEELISIEPAPSWIASILSPSAMAMIAAGSGGESKHKVENESIKLQADADRLAKSSMKAITDQLVTGSGSTIGMPELKAGKMVNIQGVGIKLSGNYYITSSTHTLSSAGYSTSFSVVKRGL